MKLRPLFLGLVIAVLLVPAVPIAAQDSTGTGCPSGPVPADAPAIRFGAAVSQTGDYATQGTDILNGYTLWQEWVNEEHGGINVGGVCSRAALVIYDDQSDPDQSAALTEKLIKEDGVSFILGPYSTDLTMVASEVTEREGVLMIEAGGSSETLFTRGFENLFGLLTPARLYTRSGIELAAALGAKTAVVVYEDTAFPTSVAEGAREWLEASGIEVLAYESYPKDVADVTDLFTRLRDLNPDLFVGGGHYKDAVLFIQTAKQVGFNPGAFLITVGPTSPTFLTDMGADAEFVWGASQWESSMGWADEYFGTASDYAARYQERFETAPSYQSAGATAAALTLQLAIESAGSIDTVEVREALKGLDIQTFFGPIQFDETGQNAGKPMATTQIQNGEILVIAPADVAVAEVIWPAPAWDAR